MDSNTNGDSLFDTAEVWVDEATLPADDGEMFVKHVPSVVNADTGEVVPELVEAEIAADECDRQEFALFGTDLLGDVVTQVKNGPLARRFEFPPFTVLSARDGAWQERKRAWLSLGIKSELGRGMNGAVPNGGHRPASQDGCYLRMGAASTRDHAPLTPVEEHAGYMVKRDDLFTVAGVMGGKVRTCWALAQGATGLVTAGSRSSPQVNIVAHVAQSLGIPCRAHVPTGDLTPELKAAQEAGAEIVQHTPGYNTVIVARAREDALERGWTEIPFGMESPEAVKQTRAQVGNIPDCKRLVVPVGSGMTLAGILHGLRDEGRALPVVGVQVGADPTKRLDRFAPDGWRDMVTLMQAPEDYADHVKASLDGLRLDPVYEAKCIRFLQPGDALWCVGLRGSTPEDAAVSQGPARAFNMGMGATKENGWKVEDNCGSGTSIFDPVLTELSYRWFCPPGGHIVDPFAGGSVRGIVAGLLGYPYTGCELSRPQVDANRVQAAEMAPYVSPRWVCGDALDSLPTLARADFVFTCPPYGDLEVYSDDPRDLSTMDYPSFVDAYRRIISAAASTLKENRFACIVQFSSGRKMGKTHQNVLVFVKGDWRKAAAACNTEAP